MKAPQECQSLAEVRSEIDRLDQSMIRTVSQRREYVHTAMRFKRSESDVHAHERQRRMLAARRLWAEEADLNPDLIEDLFRLMVDHFIAAELAILSEREDSMARGPSESKANKAAAGEFRDEADS